MGTLLAQFSKSTALEDSTSSIEGWFDPYTHDRILDTDVSQSGYNTANALVILQDIIPSPDCAKVAYMLVLFGANDACLPGGPTGQHVHLESYRENIKKILSHPAVKAHNPTIFLVTPPPINETQIWADEAANGYSAITRHHSVTSQYADAVREIAAELRNDKVILIDLNSALMRKAISLSPGYSENGPFLGTLQGGDSAGLRTLLVDGLHLTGAGYKLFIEEILPHIEIPPFVFPAWTDAPRIDRNTG